MNGDGAIDEMDTYLGRKATMMGINSGHGSSNRDFAWLPNDKSSTNFSKHFIIEKRIKN